MILWRLFTQHVLISAFLLYPHNGSAHFMRAEVFQNAVYSEHLCLTHMRQTCSGRTCFDRPLRHASGEDQQLSFGICACLAQALCIQVKIHPIGHRYHHVIHLHFYTHKKATSSRNQQKKLVKRQNDINIANQTEKKYKLKNNWENKRKQESKTKKIRFVVEIVHIWMKKRRKRCIEAAKLFTWYKIFDK